MNQFEITTAQNATIRLHIANMGDRIIAALIDLFILFGYLALLTYLENLFNYDLNFASGRNLFFWLSFILMIPMVFYSLLTEFLLNGQSPGKWLRKIRVVRMDGESLTLGNCAIRWIFRLIDFWLDSGSVGVVAAAFSRTHQRLGDMVAGTIVVSTRGEERFDLALYAQPAADGAFTFPQVERLRLADVEAVHQVLKLYYEQDYFELVLPAAARLKEAMEVMPQMDDIRFLKSVLRDYSALHSIQF